MHQFLINLKTEFHKSRNLIFAVFVFFMVATLSFFATSNAEHSSATSLDDFKPGNIMSDAVMGNYTSMSLDDIQKFLTAKSPCNNTDYDQYLASSRAYPNVTWHWSGEPYNGHFVCISEERFGEGNTIGSGQTAAEIIYGAAQEYKINPQVLIVLLEKEQGLITDALPHSGQYRAATGYGCPDTAACDSKYYGLKNQVYNAAWLFRYTLDNGYYAYPEKTRGVYIAYNPSSSCGRSEVYIENRATAALYRYTPYQPNAAALAAGSGYGDGCSAYGNRNFYLYFTRWFGSTQAVVEGEPVTIPDGVYGFVSAVASNRSLGIQGTNVTLATLDISDQSQRWRIQRDANTGYYQITNISNNRPLMAQTSEPGLGTNVILSTSSTCAKSWKIYRTNDDQLTFESACVSGMVLDVNGGSSAPGTNIQTWLTHGGASQKWRLNSERTIDDGLYAIQSVADPTQAIDVYGEYSQNGTNVQLWDKHLEGAQRWYVEYQPGGYYTLLNPSSQKYLDLNTATAKNGQNIQIWVSGGSCAQKWYIVPSGNNYNLVSSCSYGYAIDTKDSKAVAGQNIQLNTLNNSQSQQWQFVKIDPTLADGLYTIQTKISSAKAIDVYGSYTASGTNVELFDYHGGVGQQWQVTYNPKTDDYKFLNPHSGKYLDLNGSNPTAGENIQIWAGNSGCGQRWRIYNSNEGYYTINSACSSGKALDLYGGYIQNRTNIQLWYQHDGDPQRWSFTRVE